MHLLQPDTRLERTRHKLFKGTFCLREDKMMIKLNTAEAFFSFSAILCSFHPPYRVFGTLLFWRRPANMSVPTSPVSLYTVLSFFVSPFAPLFPLPETVSFKETRPTPPHCRIDYCHALSAATVPPMPLLDPHLTISGGGRPLISTKLHCYPPSPRPCTPRPSLPPVHGTCGVTSYAYRQESRITGEPWWWYWWHWPRR
jgi:hypothetical protein